MIQWLHAADRRLGKSRLTFHLYKPETLGRTGPAHLSHYKNKRRQKQALNEARFIQEGPTVRVELLGFISQGVKWVTCVCPCCIECVNRVCFRLAKDWNWLLNEHGALGVPAITRSPECLNYESKHALWAIEKVLLILYELKPDSSFSFSTLTNSFEFITIK